MPDSTGHDIAFYAHGLGSGAMWGSTWEPCQHDWGPPTVAEGATERICRLCGDTERVSHVSRRIEVHRASRVRS